MSALSGFGFRKSKGSIGVGGEREGVPSAGEIRVPGWLVGILVTVLMLMLSVVFTMGMTYGTVAETKARLDKLEDRQEWSGKCNAKRSTFGGKDSEGEVK